MIQRLLPFLTLLTLTASVHATDATAPEVIRQSSIYDYPAGFEEIYERPVMITPPENIAAFTERPAS